MPRNRQDRSREEKSAEIVAIARRLFLENGYEGTTMAAIAREAGIATNVVHWYFATKDELFVAGGQALFEDPFLLGRFPRVAADENGTRCSGEPADPRPTRHLGL